MRSSIKRRKNNQQTVKVADLPEFDAAHYLDSETSIATYPDDVLEANKAALLASALGDIAKAAGITREAPLQSPALQ